MSRHILFIHWNRLGTIQSWLLFIQIWWLWLESACINPFDDSHQNICRSNEKNDHMANEVSAPTYGYGSTFEKLHRKVTIFFVKISVWPTKEEPKFVSKTEVWENNTFKDSLMFDQSRIEVCLQNEVFWKT